MNHRIIYLLDHSFTCCNFNFKSKSQNSSSANCFSIISQFGKSVSIFVVLAFAVEESQRLISEELLNKGVNGMRCVYYSFFFGYWIQRLKSSHECEISYINCHDSVNLVFDFQNTTFKLLLARLQELKENKPEIVLTQLKREKLHLTITFMSLCRYFYILSNFTAVCLIFCYTVQHLNNRADMCDDAMTMFISWYSDVKSK